MAQPADEPLPGDSTLEFERSEAPLLERRIIWGDLAFASTRGEDDLRLTALAPTFGAFVPIRDRFAIEGLVGLSFVALSPDEGDTEASARLLNPYLAGHILGGGARFRWRAGLGIAAPVASVRDDAAEDFAKDVLTYGSYAAMTGVSNPWLWAVEQLAVVLPLRAELKTADFLLGVDGAAAVLFPIGDIDRRTDGVLQVAFDIAYVARAVSTGARLRGVFFPSVQSGDRGQLSAEPYLVFHSGSAFVRTSLVINLDEPFGFSFDDHRMWGLHLGGGTRH